MKKIIEYFQNEPATLYYILMIIALIIPVFITAIFYVLRGGA